MSSVEVKVSSGRLVGERWGAPDAPLVLCLPGLSQDERSYEYIGSRLGSDSRQVVAFAPRGRGRSDETGPGTYGLPTHSQDVLEAAVELAGGEDVPFDLVGWSFGALVTMQVANLAPARLRKIVLIDAVG